MKSLEYLAGLFDGEGCIKACNYANKKKCGSYRYWGIRVEVANTELKLVECFKERFGGCIYTIPDNRKPQYKVLYRWCLPSQLARDFLEAIEPYLLGSKKKQAQLAVALQDTKPGKHKKPHGFETMQSKLANTIKVLKHEVA